MKAEFKAQVTVNGQVCWLTLAALAALVEVIVEQTEAPMVSRAEYQDILDALFDLVGEARNELYRFR